MSQMKLSVGLMYLKDPGKVITDEQGIAVDIDEVLVPFLPELAKFHQKRVRHPVKMPIRYYHYAPLFNITEEESSKLVSDFYRSEEHSKLKPLTGSNEVLRFGPKIII